MVLSSFDEWFVKGLIGGSLLVIGYLLATYVFKRRQSNSDEPDHQSQLMIKMDKLLEEVAEMKLKIGIISLNNSHVEERINGLDNRVNDHERLIKDIEIQLAKKHK